MMRRIKFVLSDRGRLLHLAKLSAIRYSHLPIRAYPFVVQIYLESICNMDCFFCLYKGRDDIPPGFDIKMLDKMDKAISKARYIPISSCGEPLLSSNLEAVLKKIYSLNNNSRLIAIVTNGSLLSPHIAGLLKGHLADLSISINAACASVYRTEMSGEFNATINAVQSYMGAITDEDKPKVGIHFVAHKGNIGEIPYMIDLASSLGISRVRVDQFQINSQTYEHLSLLHCKEEYNAMVSEAAAIAKRKGIYFFARRFGSEREVVRCFAPWVECHVWADGRITQCCYNGSWFIGNLYEKSFEDIWFYSGDKKFARQCLSCPKILPFDDKRVHIYPYLYEKMVY